MLTKLRFYILSVLLLAGGVIALSFSISNHASADASTLIGMVNDGDIYVKPGSVSAPWATRLTTDETATQLQMYGDRVAFVDSSNNLWLKEGLTSPWFKEMSNVQSYALTGNGLLVLQSGGNVWYKNGQSPTAQWDTNLIANNGARVYLSPSQMVIIDASGNLLGKVLASPDAYNGFVGGPNGPWDQIAQNATSAAVTDSHLAYIDSGKNVYGKNGPIWYSWWNDKGVIDTRTAAVALLGTTYCPLYDNTGEMELHCKSGFGDSNGTYVFGYSVESFSLGSGGLYVLRGDDGDGHTYLRGENSSQSWTIESTTGTEITTNQE